MEGVYHSPSAKSHSTFVKVAPQCYSILRIGKTFIDPEEYLSKGTIKLGRQASEWNITAMPKSSGLGIANSSPDESEGNIGTSSSTVAHVNNTGMDNGLGDRGGITSPKQRGYIKRSPILTDAEFGTTGSNNIQKVLLQVIIK